MTRVHGRPWMPGGYDDLYDRVPGPGHRDDPGRWWTAKISNQFGRFPSVSIHAGKEKQNETASNNIKQIFKTN